MIVEELKHFLRTGTLKHISYGISREALAGLLGATDWEHFSQAEDLFPSIVKYGRLEFYFESGVKDAVLSGVMYQPIPAPALPGRLQCNYHRLSGKTTIDDVMLFLKKEKITFEERLRPGDHNVRELVSAGSVFILFDNYNESGSWNLQKAGRFVGL